MTSTTRQMVFGPALSARPVIHLPRILLTAAMLLPLAAAPAVAQQDGTQQNGTQQGNANLTVPSDQADQSPIDTKQTPDFAAFWSRYLKAIRKNDRKALQAMTHLPFDLGTDSYDAAHFTKLAAQIYDPKARDCIAHETPVHDQDNYEIFCGETVYVFGADPTLTDAIAKSPDGSGWRLLEIGAND